MGKNFNSSVFKGLSLSIISLGCDKNAIDSEEIMGLLQKDGYSIVQDPSIADIIMVNTCTFIEEARSEAIDTLLEMAKYKEQGNCRLLVALGCMAQRYHRLLLKEIPEIDLVVGMYSYSRLPQWLKHSLKKGTKIVAQKKPDLVYKKHGNRLINTPLPSAYVKIAEGCDNRCNYCIIPDVRGPYRSRSLTSIINEVDSLAKRGTKEINLIAQDTTYFGVPEHGESYLPHLLDRLSNIAGLSWIRVLYAHPRHFSDNLLEAIIKLPKVCAYLDLPLQHVNNQILSKMGRPYTKKDIINLVGKLKKADITVRTTFITGFPGEEAKHFQDLLTFIRKYPLDRVGAFTYSPEKGTPAYFFKRKIPIEISKKRQQKLINVQKGISYSLNLKEIGKVKPVLVEEKQPMDKVNKIFYRGRTPHQAPEVDGSTFFASNNSYSIGNIIDIMLTDCDAYDFYGSPQ